MKTKGREDARKRQVAVGDTLMSGPAPGIIIKELDKEDTGETAPKGNRKQYGQKGERKG